MLKYGVWHLFNIGEDKSVAVNDLAEPVTDRVIEHRAGERE